MSTWECSLDTSEYKVESQTNDHCKYAAVGTNVTPPLVPKTKTRGCLVIGKQIYQQTKALGNRTPHTNVER